MGIVDQPDEDGIVKRGITDQLMLVIHCELTGDQGGPAVDAVLRELDVIRAFPFLTLEHGQTLVEDQDVLSLLVVQ